MELVWFLLLIIVLVALFGGVFWSPWALLILVLILALFFVPRA